MMIALLLALVIGGILGFVGSVPITGPVAVLVSERGLSNRSREGIRIAIGAAAIEGVYACLAFWGIGTVIKEFPAVVPVSRLLVGVVLLIIGAYFVRKSGRAEMASAGGGGRRRGMLLGASVTAINPSILITWTVVVTAVHALGVLGATLMDAILFGAGTALGIMAWFAVLLHVLRKIRHRISSETFRRVVGAAGWLIAGGGAAMMIRGLISLI